MHPALQHLAHRPWPLPTTPWTWRQNWYDLLFAHWPIPASALRRRVPAGLTIQEFAGTSWIGAVPFRMTGVMRRPLPDLPWISAFPELNLRIYVERDGKPGVWFLSLDATNPLAVWAARRFFHLPYQHARIEFTRSPNDFHFVSQRKAASPPVNFEATYRPISEPAPAPAGSLEQFLAERYCLYASAPDGALYRSQVHHAAWPLQRAEGQVHAQELLAPHGLTLPDVPPLLHFSRGVEVVVWGLERVE